MLNILWAHTSCGSVHFDDSLRTLNILSDGLQTFIYNKPPVWFNLSEIFFFLFNFTHFSFHSWPSISYRQHTLSCFIANKVQSWIQNGAIDSRRMHHVFLLTGDTRAINVSSFEHWRKIKGFFMRERERERKSLT